MLLLHQPPLVGQRKTRRPGGAFRGRLVVGSRVAGGACCGAHRGGCCCWVGARTSRGWHDPAPLLVEMDFHRDIGLNRGACGCRCCCQLGGGDGVYPICGGFGRKKNRGAWESGVPIHFIPQDPLAPTANPVVREGVTEMVAPPSTVRPRCLGEASLLS